MGRVERTVGNILKASKISAGEGGSEGGKGQVWLVSSSEWGRSFLSSGLVGRGGGALVGHLGNEAVGVVGSVFGGLDAAVGKSDDKASLDNTGSILSLGLLKVGLAVVVVDSVLISEGLGRELLRHVGGGGISRGPGGEDSGYEGRGEDDLVHCCEVLVKKKKLEGD